MQRAKHPVSQPTPPTLFCPIWTIPVPQNDNYKVTPFVAFHTGENRYTLKNFIKTKGVYEIIEANVEYMRLYNTHLR